MAVLALLFLATSAFAHASLTATEPPDGAVVSVAPTRLALSFSEPVSPLALKLIRPNGSSGELERFVLRDRTVEIELPPGLSTGTHVFSWRVVSEDGHPVGGSIVFSIGSPSTSAPVAEAIGWPVRAAIWASRVAIYAGLFFGLGGVFAVNWFLQAQAGMRFVAAMLGIGLLGTGLSIGMQGMDALGRTLTAFIDPSVWSTGLRTTFGRTAITMAAALTLAGLSLHSQLKSQARAVSLLALVMGASALALSGHASAAEPQWLMRPSVFLHALTIAIWVGALVPLARMLQSGHPAGSNALRRFSVLIPVAASILVAVGLALAVIQMGSTSAFLGTAYGRVFLVKLVLLILLFALAAINRWRLTDRAEAGDKGAIRRLVRLIIAETLLVMIILGVAAAWRFTPPPRALAVAASQSASIHLHGKKAMAEVTVTPGRVGQVEASASVMDHEFSSLDAKEVMLVFSNPAGGVEQIKRKAIRKPNGSWTVSDLLLPIPGTWKIRLDVLIGDFEIERIEGELQIKP